MRVDYLRLDNFASIYAGMKKKKIEIDFTKRKNRVTILVGETGSGKTSIQREMNPFAYAKNDARSSSELILKGKDGYKEIHISQGNVTYVIKHFYKSHMTNGEYKIGIKSFILKNGEELNPNGNVTSFMDCVEEELKVDTNYLKLVRLGPNVETFVKMSTSERKYFISELLSEIGTYQSLYKKINTDVRSNKTLLKAAADRIKRIGVDDESILSNDLEQSEDRLKAVRIDKSSTLTRVGSLKNSIETEEGKMGEFANDTSRLVSSYHDLIQTISDKEDEFNKLLSNNNYINVDAYNVELTSKYNELKSVIKTLESDLEIILMKKVELYKTKETLELQLKGSSTLKNSVDSIGRQIALDSGFKRESERVNKWNDSTGFPFTSDDVKAGLATVQEIQERIKSLYEFDKTSVQKVLSDLIDGRDTRMRVESEMKNIDNKMSVYESKSNINDLLANNDGIYVIMEPEGHVDCPYKDLLISAVKLQNGEITHEMKSDKLYELENEKDIIKSEIDIFRFIDHIVLIIAANKKLLDILPKDFFDLDSIIVKMFNYEVIYSEEDITALIEKVIEYEEYVRVCDRINELTKELDVLEKTSGLITTIQKQIDYTDESIFKIEADITKSTNSVDSKKYDLNQLELQMGEIEKAKSIELSLNSMRELESTMRPKVEIVESYEKEITVLRESYSVTALRLDALNRSEDNLQSYIMDLKIKMSELTKVKAELEYLEESYEELIYIKKSLSSTEGIPLHFIRIFMDDTLKIVNELLFEIYNGEFEIEKFVIDENEFRIPYIKNGIVVSDISRCSQGEESFLMIALSFALIAKSIDEYDIILLDEVDGPLDINKREKFILNLEKFIDIIGAEHVTIISHNNVFDNYPVDIIRTSNINIDNYKNLNLLYSVV